MNGDAISKGALAIAVLGLSACSKHVDEVGAPTDAGPAGFTVDLLEDWEDGDRDILRAGGRFGHWYDYDDQTEGSQSMAVVALDPVDGRHTTTAKTVSKMALRVSASGYSKWGSGYQADFAAASPYDVSAYTGVVLWAKSVSPDPRPIRVVFPDINSDPRGHVCAEGDAPPEGTGCYDHFGQNIDLTPEWSMYLLPFWALTQNGFGLHEEALDVHHVLQIAVANNAGMTYDYLLDDVGFYRE